MNDVWVLGVFVSVDAAVAVGVNMASLEHVKRMTDFQLESVELSSADADAPSHSPAEQAAFASCVGKFLLIHLGGPMTFGAANGLTKRLADVSDYRLVVLDFADVPHIDDSAAMALESIIDRAAEGDQPVILSGLRRPVVRAFIRFGMLRSIKRCIRFRRRLDALNHASEIFKEPED
jgi:SulP family sulfate permease